VDSSTLTAIALIGYFAVIALTVWLAFRFAKPKPPPWDGQHRIKYVKFVEDFGNMPDDYRNGWAWACTCGAKTPSLPTRLVYTEAHAVVEFKRHKELYK
jgi:hypothetical protein